MAAWSMRQEFLQLRSPVLWEAGAPPLSCAEAPRPPVREPPLASENDRRAPVRAPFALAADLRVWLTHFGEGCICVGSCLSCSPRARARKAASCKACQTSGLDNHIEHEASL